MICFSRFSHELALRLQEEEDRQAAAAINQQRQQQQQLGPAPGASQGPSRPQGHPPQAAGGHPPTDRRPREERRKEGKDVSLFDFVHQIHDNMYSFPYM